MSADVGYIYRVALADADQLRTLINKHVGNGGWTFGGAAQWDFVSTEGQKNLRELKPIADTEPIDVKGDFGHAFSESAEVRWKRRDDGRYDVLVLSEQPQIVQGGSQLSMPHWNARTRMWEDGAWTVRQPSAAMIRQAGGRSPISYIDYLAPNGAVQFLRLRKVGP